MNTTCTQARERELDCKREERRRQPTHTTTRQHRQSSTEQSEKDPKPGAATQPTHSLARHDNSTRELHATHGLFKRQPLHSDEPATGTVKTFPSDPSECRVQQRQVSAASFVYPPCLKSHKKRARLRGQLGLFKTAAGEPAKWDSHSFIGMKRGEKKEGRPSVVLYTLLCVSIGREKERDEEALGVAHRIQEQVYILQPLERNKGTPHSSRFFFLISTSRDGPQGRGITGKKE